MGAGHRGDIAEIIDGPEVKRDEHAVKVGKTHRKLLMERSGRCRMKRELKLRERRQ